MLLCVSRRGRAETAWLGSQTAGSQPRPARYTLDSLAVHRSLPLASGCVSILQLTAQVHQRRRDEDYRDWELLLTEYVGVKTGVPRSPAPARCLRRVLLAFLNTGEDVVDEGCGTFSNCCPDGVFLPLAERAGRIIAIPAFGAFVVRGNLVVGLIVFCILITIQFVVVASGSQRVAEVAARFTLDALPGKQMAIDAEVHAGIIDGEAAGRKRARVQKEADFYGAMDGAGKFVKGDAVAALIIVVLNLVGGVLVGCLYRGLSPIDALNTFALLSIGNALVTTLPAFLMSIAMGMMVTRVAADGSLGLDLASQMLAHPDLLRAAACLVAASLRPRLHRAPTTCPNAR